LGCVVFVIGNFILSVQILVGTQDYFLLLSVQTDCGAPPTSYLMGVGVLFSGVKRSGCDVGHQPPSSSHMFSWLGTGQPLFSFLKFYA